MQTSLLQVSLHQLFPPFQWRRGWLPPALKQDQPATECLLRHPAVFPVARSTTGPSRTTRATTGPSLRGVPPWLFRGRCHRFRLFYPTECTNFDAPARHRPTPAPTDSAVCPHAGAARSAPAPASGTAAAHSPSPLPAQSQIPARVHRRLRVVGIQVQVRAPRARRLGVAGLHQTQELADQDWQILQARRQGAASEAHRGDWAAVQQYPVRCCDWGDFDVG